ncbi:MAG: hypothetical protein AAGA54_29380 [Myxococcota bacterium]
MRSLKICFWCTSFQADNQALAAHLAQSPGFEVLVAMDDPARYSAEPVERLLPMRGRWLDRRDADTPKAIEAWAPDVLVVDNHLPKQRLAPRVFVLWHGFGWRYDDLSVMRKQLRKLVGDVTRPNRRFRWQAFGEWDQRYRVSHSRLDPENVVALGSAYSDVLLPGSDVQRRFSRAEVQAHYCIDLSRPTVLVGLSWHHGGALGHWGDDEALHEQLVAHVGASGANVLLRLHDRHRYEPAYVAVMEGLAARHAHVALKFKSESPDSLVDLLVSDVMISNYSSFLNAFYYTQRPSIHIDPVSGISGQHVTRTMKRGKLRVRSVRDPLSTWKLSPDEIGGLRATSFEELLAAIDLSLADPTCCQERSARFVARYITNPDGHTRERIGRALAAWVRS